jgi:hypothetical protein
LGIRATARVFEVDANTVLHWLAEAAEQLRAFSAYFLCKLHLSFCKVKTGLKQPSSRGQTSAPP